MSSILKLKVLWQTNFLGLAVNQQLKEGSIPISSYYVWPKTGAWEQLKLELDSKLWLTEQQRTKILNVTAEIMNFWRQKRHEKNVKFLVQKFDELFFVELQTI